MAFTHQALVESAVFAVNGIEHAVGVLQQAVNQFARYHQGFFVGKGNAFAGTDGGNRRFQATVAHHGGHYGVNLGRGNRLCDGSAACGYYDVGVLEGIAHIVIVLLIGDDDHVRTAQPCLCNQQVGTTACHEQPGVEQVRILSNDVKRLPANGSRAAQHRNISFQCHFIHELQRYI